MSAGSEGTHPRSERLARLASVFCRIWFRYRFRGWERLPPSPCLLVGNHSATGVPDVLCIGGAWPEHFGDDRIAYGLTSDPILATPIIGRAAQALGAVRATRDNALRFLRAGYDVLVFPGGELDSFRPLHEPRHVEFGNRRGYARIALETGVPIAPIVTLGAHYAYLQLPGGRTLAKLGVKRFVRTDVVPMPLGLFATALVAVMSLALGWSPLWFFGALLLSLVPTPVRITSEALPAIDAAAIAPDAPFEERVEAVHDAVHGALQKHLLVMEHSERRRE